MILEAGASADKFIQEQPDQVGLMVQNLMWMQFRDEVRDLHWLSEAQFRQRTVHETTWPAEHVQQLLGAIQGLASGTVIRDEKLDIAYWLSHHVMHRVYDETACTNMALRLKAAAQRQRSRAAVTAEADEDADDANELGGCDDAVESDDEVDIRVLNDARATYMATDA